MDNAFLSLFKIFCGGKLANDSMKPTKLKRDQKTKHLDRVGKSKKKEDAGPVKQTN